MKNSKISTIIICTLTLITAILTLITKIYDRKQLVYAVKDENIVTLLKTKEKTEIL
ncbi:MAG: hypothetical protein R3Y35_07785 [Clostridia bacterium]